MAQRLHKEPMYGTMSVTRRSKEMEDAVDVRTPLCRFEITHRLPVHFFGVFDRHGPGPPMHVTFFPFLLLLLSRVL
ncbi:hypothetical protein CDL15_Pgr000367 [Punica granatum]|nr:hypothetical protein CDL15_Pgr000367 [Punica granatum]